MDSLFSSDRNRFQFFPCCFACNPLPASPRSVVRSRCDNLFGNIAAEQKFWCTFLELRPCRLSNFPRFDFARDHLAHPWSRNHGPLFERHLGFSGLSGLDAAGDAVAFQHLLNSVLDMASFSVLHSLLPLILRWFSVSLVLVCSFVRPFHLALSFPVVRGRNI